MIPHLASTYRSSRSIIALVGTSLNLLAGPHHPTNDQRYVDSNAAQRFVVVSRRLSQQLTNPSCKLPTTGELSREVLLRRLEKLTNAEERDKHHRTNVSHSKELLLIRQSQEERTFELTTTLNALEIYQENSAIQKELTLREAHLVKSAKLSPHEIREIHTAIAEFSVDSNSGSIGLFNSLQYAHFILEHYEHKYNLSAPSSLSKKILLSLSVACIGFATMLQYRKVRSPSAQRNA